MSEETSNSSTGMGSSDSTAAKPAKTGLSRGLLIGGLVAIVVIAGVILTTNNSDAPRSGTATCATTSQGCEIGDIGPGGGRVFSLGDAPSPADCSGTEVLCLEVASRAWQEPSPPPAASPDLVSDYFKATSTVATYGTTTAAAGQWRIPTLDELKTLANLSATDQANVNGFDERDGRNWQYWSSTASSSGRNYIVQKSFNGITVGTLSRFTGSDQQSRPIHAF